MVVMLNGSREGNSTWLEGSWTTQSMARPPGPPLVHDGGGEDEETTRSGIPIRLIWVPYLVLTLIIISLMIASFVRFHVKHGHKYLRRREELMLRHHQRTQAAAEAAAASTQNPQSPPPNGGPNLTVTIVPTPTTIPPVKPSNDNHLMNHHRPPPTGNSHRRANPNNHRSLNNRLPPPHKINSKHSSGNVKKTRRRNRPIAFARNSNGSMVDLRVAGVDSVSMFKSSFSTAASRRQPIHWSLPERGRPPPYTSISSPGSGLSDEEDDHVLLIHQSKV